VKEPTIFHSVRLEEDKCVGCTTCIKKCPTEAIRVRKGRASIIDERCIDCGECIRTCPHGAKKAVSDPLSMIADYRVKVAVPAPSLYSQFEEATSVDRILSGLLELGFDEIFEVAEAAELVTEATKRLLDAVDRPRPLISSACPAVVKLVQLRFPSLLPHLVPLLPPMEVAARAVKERLHAGEEGVGVFFITPCAGKVTVTRSPLGYERSALDGVIGIKDIYIPLRNAISTAPERSLARAGASGIGWGRVDGESEAIGERGAISVDGIGNVIGVLEALENGKLKDVAYIEALACPAGCVGGPLTVENPYIAKNRLRNREAAAAARTTMPGAAPEARFAALDALGWTQGVRSRFALALDPDMLKALVMMEEMELIAGGLPGLDCGSCGAPTCRAFAEDIVRGQATEAGCVFKLRENIRKLARELIALEEIQPPGLDREEVREARTDD
jgi:iron only hydrogenase large subunit-like protein